MQNLVTKMTTLLSHKIVRVNPKGQDTVYKNSLSVSKKLPTINYTQWGLGQA